MTREEYIDFANALKNNYTIDFDKLPEFCDMAISALKEEWIPIEEGKPKHKQMVFVTYDHEGEIKVDKTMYHERHGFAISPNVIAWRDIQPYKKGE